MTGAPQFRARPRIATDMPNTILILQQRADRLHVLQAGNAIATWTERASWQCRPMPRSLAAERAFIRDLSEGTVADICLTGIERPADIEKASALLRVVEAKREPGATSLKIIARLDTAEAALGLSTFNKAIPRLIAFLFDPVALAEAAGVAAGSALIGDLRTRLPLAAKASGAAALLKCHGAVDDHALQDAALNGYAGLCIPA